MRIVSADALCVPRQGAAILLAVSAALGLFGVFLVIYALRYRHGDRKSKGKVDFLHTREPVRQPEAPKYHYAHVAHMKRPPQFIPVREPKKK